MLRYGGIHFGWTAIDLSKKLQDDLHVDDDWYEAIISIVPNPSPRADVVQKKVVRVYIIEKFEGAQVYDAKISVIVMAYIRPAPRSRLEGIPYLEVEMADLYKDIASGTISLATPAWKAGETLARVRSAASSRSSTERYVNVRQSTQTQTDRVPTWRLGVRTDGAALKDRSLETEV